MKPRKPDRWDRMANKFFAHEGPFYAVEVAELLRKEHAWMRRTVRQHVKSIDGLRADLPPLFVEGYTQAGHEFLAVLDQRSK